MPLFSKLKKRFRRSQNSSHHSTNQPESEAQSAPVSRASLNSGANADPNPVGTSTPPISTPLLAGTSLASTAPTAPPTAIHHANLSRSQAQPNSSPAPPTSHSANKNVKNTAWSGYKLFEGLLKESAGVFGPLKSAVSELSGCIEIFETIARNREDFRALRDQLDSLFADLHKYFGAPTSPAMTSVIINLSQGIKKETEFVLQKQQRKGINRVAESMEDQNEILECYRRIQMLIQRVALNVNMDTWRIVDKIATNNYLNSLSPSRSAWYSSADSTQLRRRGCTENTRVIVMETLREWSGRDGSEKIYWLNGMAGTGKTTIAYSLCKHLEAINTLAASFFCSRQLPECRNVNLIIPTIAYQLANFSHPFKCALSLAIEQNPDAHTRKLSEQFTRLLVEPLREVTHTIPAKLVVVIDALDEIENKDGVAQMLDVLLLHAPDLPLKFFTTSRAEPRIQSRMMSPEGEHMRLKLHLHDLEHSIVKEDIKTYIQSELARMAASPSELDSLCKRSGVLFIHAATAIRYISDQDFSWGAKRLQIILNVSNGPTISKYQEIDALYRAILNDAFEGTDLEQAEKTSIYGVLHTVVCAQEPLEVKTMVELLGLDGEADVHAALRMLFAVLNVSEKSGLITTLHESFPDFLFDQDRSGAFYCDKAQRHTQITLDCFQLVRSVRPQFNICGLESSYVLDRYVPGLEQRIEAAISKGLFYACRYWVDHLMLAKLSGNNLDALYGFLSERLLLWMEIMNLKKQLQAGVGLLARLEAWTRISECPASLYEIAEDAWRFTIGVTSSPIVESTPHIYVSALAFWLKKRPVWKHYYPRMHGIVKITGSSQQNRESATLAVCTSDSAVYCIAYSPDGSRIVSGSEDQSIRIWDAHTGQMIGEPLLGHTNYVGSVAYSPDGSRIVSGSNDRTIRIWDAHTGQTIGEPLQGHTDDVTSVAYSPDGSRIVSGSEDQSIRIWDAHTGQTIGEPLLGHTDHVTSVAYSPDGSRIASGSNDRTIRIWDAHTGQTIGEPLQGHTWYIRSVAYSPDGSRIVSGSNDATIRIWDAHTGQTIGEPLQGHTWYIRSVAYSPDGSRIVSGSEDKTIRIWDAHTGQTIGEPLQGHTSSVRSVAYSPDGSRIVSGSEDETIRIWDAHTGQTIGEPLQGHTWYVTSVAYSPDGSRIVSGSNDRTIRIWDAHTGQTIGEPLQGHIWYVTSVAYSPDGSRIVSGSNDRTIRIWDARTGRAIGEPLQGHTGYVTSVVYSPDESRIVSGSGDKTIRIWDAHTGQTVGEPLQGHAHSVTSAAYSPDGSRIVSGSNDKTIRIWDAHTGQTIGEPLQGHTDDVTSVAYSPDGSRIVSGSDDKTIRIWDARTGRAIGEPLQGHTGYVTSVVYSPDGSRIVSGSEDQSIRIWDAHTGQMIGEPLLGHTNYVGSVAYSPDGSRIVSGSNDRTIRIWDAHTRLTDLGLEQHIVHSSHPCSSSNNSHQPQSSQSLSTVPPYSTWKLRDDGCIVSDHSELLIWIPYDLRNAALLRPNTILAISRYGWLHVDFDAALIGNLWRSMGS